mmetsp:Transcript_7418/g.11063  ORF Transcript_7418/g.11063 Transcript_7418/m.11063 type:complete len:686 (-) Transcript_7418:1148-3205(-)
MFGQLDHFQSKKKSGLSRGTFHISSRSSSSSMGSLCRASSSPITLPPVIPDDRRRPSLPSIGTASSKSKRPYHQQHQGATDGQARDASKRSRTGNRRSSRKEKSSSYCNDEEASYSPLPHPNYAWHYPPGFSNGHTTAPDVEPNAMSNHHHHHHHPSQHYGYYMGYHHQPSHYQHHYGAPLTDRSTSPTEEQEVNAAPDPSIGGVGAPGHLSPPYPPGPSYYSRGGSRSNSRRQGHSHPDELPLYARPPHPHMYDYPSYPYPYWYEHHGYMENSLSSEYSSSSSTTEVASIPGSEHFYGKIPSSPPEIRHASEFNKSSSSIPPYEGRGKGKRNRNLESSVSSVESSGKGEDRLTLPTVPTKANRSSRGENLPMLALPEDRLILSEALCIVRENLEVFSATAADINAPAPGRKNIVSLGQVGIRCIHCVNCKSRVKRAQCYPSNISRIYRTVTDMKLDHFSTCPMVPPEIKARLEKLKAVSTRSNTSTMQYFKESAKRLNMVNTNRGIYFRDSKHLSSDQIVLESIDPNQKPKKTWYSHLLSKNEANPIESAKTANLHVPHIEKCTGTQMPSIPERTSVLQDEEETSKISEPSEAEEVGHESNIDASNGDELQDVIGQRHANTDHEILLSALFLARVKGGSRRSSSASPKSPDEAITGTNADMGKDTYLSVDHEGSTTSSTSVVPI